MDSEKLSAVDVVVDALCDSHGLLSFLSYSRSPVERQTARPGYRQGAPPHLDTSSRQTGGKVLADNTTSKFLK